MPGTQALRALGKRVQTCLGLADQPHRLTVAGDQLLERRPAVGEPRDGSLESIEELIQGDLGPAQTDSTILPSTPFTKRPDSSPENVLASSMDSLMAARTGTSRAITIS